MIVLPIEPNTKPRMTQRDRWAKRPCVVKYYEWSNRLRLLMGANELPPTFAVTFILPMPRSWSKKKRIEMVGQPHQQVPDADNLCKALQDALTEQDNYIWSVHKTKIWGYHGAIVINPIEVQVSPEIIHVAKEGGPC